MSLSSITYVSTGTGRWDFQRLKSLLQICRLNNEKNGITGLLLFSEGSFMQTFEGPEEAVKTLYKNIENDPSHHGIIKLFDEQISERSYKDWKMAFKSLDEKIDGYSNFLNEISEYKDERALIASNAAMRLMESFRNRISDLPSA